MNKIKWSNISRRKTDWYSRVLGNSRKVFQIRARAGTRSKYALARVFQHARGETRSHFHVKRGQWDLAGWRGKIRFERTSGRFRLGSLVLRINQLCLSVFHRAGGELISFPLNTNFFSGRKPISIKMARAFRILPDYKRLPPLLPPRRPRLHKFALRPPSRSGGALIPPVRFPTSFADSFLFFSRSASIGCGCSYIERLDRRIVNTELVWSEFWRGRSPVLARYTVNLVTVYIVFRAANFGISYFW